MALTPIDTRITAVEALYEPVKEWLRQMRNDQRDFDTAAVDFSPAKTLIADLDRYKVDILVASGQLVPNITTNLRTTEASFPEMTQFLPKDGKEALYLQMLRAVGDEMTRMKVIAHGSTSAAEVARRLETQTPTGRNEAEYNFRRTQIWLAVDAEQRQYGGEYQTAISNVQRQGRFTTNVAIALLDAREIMTRLHDQSCEAGTKANAIKGAVCNAAATYISRPYTPGR